MVVLMDVVPATAFSSFKVKNLPLTQGVRKKDIEVRIARTSVLIGKEGWTDKTRANRGGLLHSSWKRALCPNIARESPKGTANVGSSPAASQSNVSKH